MDLRSPVTALPTVRGASASGLARLGIRTVRDLLFHFPRRHEDRRTMTPIADVRPAQAVVVQGTLRGVRTERTFRRYRKGTRPVLVTHGRITDETGSLPIRWFHQRFLEQAYPSETAVYLVGTVNAEGEFIAPEIERFREGRAPLHVGRLVPVYPETSGVTSRLLRYLISRVLPLAGSLREYLPSPVREVEELVDLRTAVAQIHFPDDEISLERARERLAFDELFVLQLAALTRRAARRAETSCALLVTLNLIADALRALPFALTPSQNRALDDILRDLQQPVPMARLLAGDVGSGKTVVAGLAALAVARGGGQTALLAPTEILVQQHAETLRELLGHAGLLVSVLTSSSSPAERQGLREGLERGTVSLVVGTHALLHTSLAFKNLVLVIVDEQHRFGVLQRAELTGRGPETPRGPEGGVGPARTTPHFLSLSATPIPRTLQLTAFGDVDVSPLDPRPNQRPVRTEIVPPSSRNTMYASLKNRIASGGQVFVICPRVEEDKDDERKSVEAEYRRLRQGVLRAVRMERLHGRMQADEKNQIIAAFRARDTDLLVASTVVEVGVDVPHADALLVEGAEHFGLATLHQLRGRVGRRGQDSVCYLATEAEDLDVLDRLHVLVRTSNGLEIAEEDLRRRGPGEPYGTRQHGGVVLRIANLANLTFLLRVRAAAERLTNEDRTLETAPALRARIQQLNVATHFE